MGKLICSDVSKESGQKVATRQMIASTPQFFIIKRELRLMISHLETFLRKGSTEQHISRNNARVWEDMKNRAVMASLVLCELIRSTLPKHLENRAQSHQETHLDICKTRTQLLWLAHAKAKVNLIQETIAKEEYISKEKRKSDLYKKTLQ